MKKTILFFLILGLITLSSFKLHKFYVSVTQIEHNEQEQTLQIISRIFIDDIEDLLKTRYDESLTIDITKEDPKLDEYLKKYLDKKIKITINNKDISFNFLGKEYEDDLMICYLEVQNVSSLEAIHISNELLMDIFEEQQNIVHVKKENQRKSLILEKGKSKGLLNFSE